MDHSHTEERVQKNQKRSERNNFLLMKTIYIWDSISIEKKVKLT